MGLGLGVCVFVDLNCCFNIFMERSSFFCMYLRF